MDGYWHHIAVTWENTAGQWILYINGTNKGGGNLSAGQTIGKGVIVIGQDQDSYKGSFESEQTFQGKLTGLNMWERVLSAGEVSGLNSSKCSSAQGNIVKWNDLFKKEQFGQVKVACESFCN